MKKQKLLIAIIVVCCFSGQVLGAAKRSDIASTNNLYHATDSGTAAIPQDSANSGSISGVLHPYNTLSKAPDGSAFGKEPDTNHTVGTYITKATLENASKRVRAFKPRDSFDTAPQFPELVGRSFLVEVSPINGGGINRSCFGSPEYVFDANKSELTLMLGYEGRINDYNFPTGPIDDFDTHAVEYAFQCSVIYGKHRYGSNAFGVTIPVDVRNETFDALVMPLERFKTAYWSWKKHLASEQARTLVKSLQLRISGTIGEWSVGRPILCGEAFNGATLDAAVEVTRRGCLVNAKIDHIEAFDSATGQVISSDN